MSFLNKFKDMFRKKEISLKEVNKTIGIQENNDHEEIFIDGINVEKEEITDETSISINELDETPEIQSMPEKTENIQDMDNNMLKIDFENLDLGRIESEAETINNYLRGLIKDLGLYQDLKNDNDKTNQAVNNIVGKIKVINNHGSELKNLLNNLINNYYNIIIEHLKSINLNNNEEMQKLIWTVEMESNMVKELDNQLNKIMAYNQLFNPDINQKYTEEIEKEVINKKIHEDLNLLINNILNIIIDKNIGIKTKIENNETLKTILKLSKTL